MIKIVSLCALFAAAQSRWNRFGPDPTPDYWNVGSHNNFDNYDHTEGYEYNNYDNYDHTEGYAFNDYRDWGYTRGYNDYDYIGVVYM